MKNIQKIINLKTTFNSKNLPKINTYTHKSNETFPTPLHGYFEYSEIPSPERKVLFIRGKYLKTNQDNFIKKNKILKTLDNFDLENFSINLWNINISSYNKLKKASINHSKVLGMMAISYDYVKSKEYNDDQFFIDFDIILKSTEFNKFVKEFSNVKSIKHNFEFKINLKIDMPKQKDMVYLSDILDFRSSRTL